MLHRARDGGLVQRAASADSHLMRSLTEEDPGSPLASGEGNLQVHNTAAPHLMRGRLA